MAVVENPEPLTVDYVAEPTAAEFHDSDALIRGLRGPIGTGKSVACVNDAMALSLQQAPFNGVRKVRGCCVRNTYPELKSTTIKTWLDWYPSTRMRWDAPITGALDINLPDGTRLELEVIFLAVDRPADVKKLKSLDLTWIWLNEVSELAKPVFDMAVGRIARYPRKQEGGATYPFLSMDTNPPDDDHWYYKLDQERDDDAIEALQKTLREVADFTRPLMEFFALPPALLPVGRGDSLTWRPNPEAEGVRHQSLGIAYWLNQVAGKAESWIKVYLCGEYGTVLGGKPVYPEFRQRFHVAKADFKPIGGLPILLGWDFGLTPALVIAQATQSGQLRIIEEACGTDIGIREFARNVAKPLLKTKYKGFEVLSWADPAGRSRSQISHQETCIKELNRAGIPTQSAWTNEFSARREAVAGFMTKMPRGEPGMLISPRCKVLIKGFAGRYHYERMEVTGEERFRDVPAKNAASHPHDALQYIALHVDRDVERETTKARRMRTGRTTQSRNRYADAYA